MLTDGDPYAYVVRSDGVTPSLWKDLLACDRVLRRDLTSARVRGTLPGNRIALAHMRSLQALDGVAACASQRAIAEVLFGVDRVAKAWHDDGALRAQIRHLICRGQVLMRGGYVNLLTGFSQLPAPRQSIDAESSLRTTRR